MGFTAGSVGPTTETSLETSYKSSSMSAHHPHVSGFPRQDEHHKYKCPLILTGLFVCSMCGHLPGSDLGQRPTIPKVNQTLTPRPSLWYRCLTRSYNICMFIMNFVLSWRLGQFWRSPLRVQISPGSNRWRGTTHLRFLEGITRSQF